MVLKAYPSEFMILIVGTPSLSIEYMIPIVGTPIIYFEVHEY